MPNQDGAGAFIRQASISEKTMAKTRKRKLRIQLIALFLFLTASLATLSLSTYAWFAMNKSVRGTGLRIEADYYDAVTSVEYYAAEAPDVSLTPTAYYFDKAGLGENDDVEIPIYDRIFKDDPHQLLIKISINSRVNACNLLVKADERVITSGSWDDIDWHYNYDHDKGNPLSSVVSFIPYPSNYVTSETRNAKDCYKLQGNVTNHSFVSLDNSNNPIYDSDATIELASYTFTDDHTIYLMLDYDASLVESIYSHYLADTLFNTGYNITFASDFTISISVTEEDR